MFIGSHFWFAPDGAAFTSPSAGIVGQDEATWPDEDEASWAAWKLGIIETFDIDPKYGPREEVLVPSPGAVQARDIIIPYGIPEIKFTTTQVDGLAWQLALNTQALFANATVITTPNGGGGPGVRGILKAQHYDHENAFIANWMSWGVIYLDGTLNFAPKQMTRPKFMATLLYSANNIDEFEMAPDNDGIPPV